MSVTEFFGKAALVTGGTSGIGRATVLALVREGADVVFTGRREAEGRRVESEAQGGPGKAIFVQGDVTREEDIEKAVAEAVKLRGTLNFAFNNAGVEIVGVNTIDATPEQYRRVFDTNVLGVLLSLKHELRAMAKSGGGSIVNNASVAGSIGMASAGIYIASKHAVLGLTKSAALEGAKDRVRVNAVSPAAIETDMLDRFTGGRNQDAMNWLTSMHPIGRIGTAEEVARPVLFLLSSAASFMTGHDLKVDGGLTVP